MPTVVGVRLRFASKNLWFDPSGTQPEPGDRVIVETERGREVGTVTQAPFEVQESELPAALKPVVRISTQEDLERETELEQMAQEAVPVFRDLIAEHKLDMKPVDAEYLFDGDKLVFYFSAEERVDFRDLVRDLASRFKARIELRQIGVRDEARIVGGIGHCGQQLCCVRFSGDFQPVSIRMAKEQDLPLNPLKISGLCGRLMCCLRYEFDAYKDFKSRAPKRGSMIETPAGDAKVTDLNTPREIITMRLGDGNTLSVPLGEMTCGKGCGCPCKVSDETFEAVASPAMIAPKPAAAPPEPPRQPAREGEKRKKKAQEPTASEQPKEGRRRRRRRSGSAKQEGGDKATPPQEASSAKGTDQPPAKGKEAASDAGTGARKRRRRRRRPGGGQKAE